MDRNNIDNKYKWNLNEIYSDNDSFNKDLNRVLELTDKELEYKGKVLKSSETLYTLLELNLESERILDKLYTYASLNYSLDTRSSEYSKLVNNLMDTYTEISTKLSFVTTELSKLTTEKLDEYLKSKPDLKKYEFSLRKIIKDSEHILGLKEEELLSTLGNVLDAGSEVFDKLDNADIDLGEIQDSAGNSHKLTSGSYREFMGSADRTLRKNATYKMHEYYKKHANSIAECLSNHVKTNCVLSKIRKYSSPLEASLSHDNLTTKFYDNLLNSVHNHLDTLHKMMKTYQEALNIDEMHIYDINTRIGNVPDKKYTPEEIKDMVRKSLEVMGEDYLKVVDKAFNENWIDFYETTGKTSGAFSGGAYDTKPYILLNYTGSFDDAETLAHELGHSVHSYYSRKNCDAENANYPIFLAEIASTTQEVLFNDYLLKNTDDKEMKIYILNNILSNYKSTVYRQLEFAEFEKIVHEKCASGINLTKDDFTSIYHELEKKYYGKDVIIDDIIDYECLRIPHFYTSFYVYKYATGLAIAYKFARSILNKEPGATDNYVKFLSSGGKDYPLNILKSCNIDLENTDVIEDSVKIINEYLDEFTKLISERS